MADQKDLDYTYTLIDVIFRFCFGETEDFSGAKYDGDFSISLEEAQRRKHEFIADSLNIKKGSRVLDMGCGWGPFLKYIEERGAEGIGMTLSTGQERACRKNGLNVYLMDCRTIDSETFGIFDAISCIGAFEAFCSREEYETGKQDEIYNSFFKVVYDLLPESGRFYMQTMIFGKNIIEYKDFDIRADKDSDAYVCALLQKQFPGNWLPYSVEQIIEDAKPYFRLVTKNNGRLDYIETQKQWREKLRRFNFKKYLFYLSLIPKYVTSKDFRKRIDLFGINANREGFERKILDHFRLVFEKV